MHIPTLRIPNLSHFIDKRPNDSHSASIDSSVNKLTSDGEESDESARVLRVAPSIKDELESEFGGLPERGQFKLDD